MSSLVCVIRIGICAYSQWDEGGVNISRFQAWTLKLFCVWHKQQRFCVWYSGKQSACSAGDAGNVGAIPVLGRSPGGGHGNPLQCSCLENRKNRGSWRATVHGVPKSQTWLSRHRCTRSLFSCKDPLEITCSRRYHCKMMEGCPTGIWLCCDWEANRRHAGPLRCCGHYITYYFFFFFFLIQTYLFTCVQM